jgi:ligand-binding sensor domain-containing protein/signal transduction histidine kinase
LPRDYTQLSVLVRGMIQKLQKPVTSFSICGWIVLVLHLTGVPVFCANLPKARVNPTPVKLPVIFADDIRFTSVTTSDGLSQTHVGSIVQDDLGFLWFGTVYGLNRFDGYTFKVFVHEPNNPNSLSGVNVSTLFKDREGILWIGCEQFLDRFDPKTETFIHYPVRVVKHISQDRAGILWLSTASGLYRVDQSGNIRLYSHDPKDPESLADNDIRSTAEDKTGRFWVADSSGLEEMDRATGHVRYRIPIRNPSREFSFYEDGFGVFWIFYASGNGLASFDHDKKALTYYSFQPNNISSTAYSGVTAMLEDRQGNLWLATQGSGLMKFDREHRRLVSYRYEPGDPDSLAENRVYTLFQDGQGSIWVALFEKGLQRFVPEPAAFHPVGLQPKEGGIGCFYEDSHRNLWIGTRPALYRLDSQGKTTAFRAMKSGVPFDVISIVEDAAGLMWIGTFNNGLFRLDPKTSEWKNYRHAEEDSSSLSNDIVIRLLVDHRGTLWAATWDGLDRFDAQTGHFTTFHADSHNHQLIYNALAEGREDDLWLGTNVGLQQFNTTTAQFTTYSQSDSAGSLSDNEVNYIHVPRSGPMWVATQNGLNKFDSSTRSFTVYGIRDGVANSAVSCVLEDRTGKLWMSTHKGVTSLDPSTMVVRNFSKPDGLPGPDMGGWGACLHSQSGQMFFAGFSGATSFKPEDVPRGAYVPPTVITDFRLLGENSRLALDRSPVHSAISYSSSIALSHKQNIFSLTFAALGYSNPQTNRYRYMLESLDRSWNEVGSDSRTVTYTSLPVGKFRFRVQGATNNSEWSQPGAELQLIILPPWWNTLWFRTVCLSAALFLVWVAYRYRMMQIAKQFEIRLEARVNERTRIARELHDTLLQTLHGLLFQFQAVRNLFPRRPEEAVRSLDDAINETEKALAESRDAIQDLRCEPMAKENLADLLTTESIHLTNSGGGNHQLPVFDLVEEGKRRTLSPTVNNEICRIALEVVRNAFHHAQASRIEAEIRYDDQMLRVRIRDDGRGIDPKVLKEGGVAGHWGLRGVRERAERIGARVDFWSEAGAGTEVQLTVPASVIYEGPGDGVASRLLQKIKKRA